jgi:hypothetical protein
MSGHLRDHLIPARAGIGYRTANAAQFAESRPDIAFLEVHTENYFHAGGHAPRELDRLRELYPISLHGVGLALGSTDALDTEHLARVRAAVQRFEPALVSEHACWGAVAGEHFNDLLPLPYTEEAVNHLAARIRQVQDTLGRCILLENVSQYVGFTHSTLSEGEYLAAIVSESQCELLVDINNLYVNASNLGSDPRAVLEQIPARAVGQYHLAGHTRKVVGDHTLLIDDHGSRVAQSVWDLFDDALARLGPRPTLIEWDTDVPALEVLLAEAQLADQHLARSHAHAA